MPRTAASVVHQIIGATVGAAELEIMDLPLFGEHQDSTAAPADIVDPKISFYDRWYANDRAPGWPRNCPQTNNVPSAHFSTRAVRNLSARLSL